MSRTTATIALLVIFHSAASASRTNRFASYDEAIRIRRNFWQSKRVTEFYGSCQEAKRGLDNENRPPSSPVAHGARQERRKAGECSN